MVIRGSIFLILIQAAVLGSIQNGGFEFADPNQPNPHCIFPRDWTVENYASLHTHFVPSPEWGQVVNWKIHGPVEGTRFCLLSTGDLYGPGSDTQITQSSMSQKISFANGDILMGSYFFGTCDYRPYDDTATILLSPVDPNDGLRNILIESISVEDVGNYGATIGWMPFSFTFTPETAGCYKLYFEVKDVTDNKYKSYLAIDNLRICNGIPLYGDINQDCGVDLQDVAYFSNLWLADCNDPNTYDPNYICRNADFDGNMIIDPNDLVLMSEHWLENYRVD
jgi:hypothetical protein